MCAERSRPVPTKYDEDAPSTAEFEKATGLYKVTFLGGLLLQSQIQHIEGSSKIGVQYAADTLQKALLRGFASYPDIRIDVVNLPFIGSYPRADRTARFPAVSEFLFGKIPVLGMGFFNLAVARNLSRMRAAYRGLRQVLLRDEGGLLVVYSAHLPFIRAALAARKMNSNLLICVVVPDLIEHMTSNHTHQRFIAWKESRAFTKLAQDIDFFVVLTAPTAKHLNLPPEKHVVVEGIVDPDQHQSVNPWSAEPGPIFIYAGTIEARYGILDLLTAFAQLQLPSAKLWICGDGDARGAVEELARRDPRVTYYGRLPRTEALALQAKAHVMVNPRRPEGEFTLYSFPSKTMEYLASGRPVLMHWLPGIPEAYRPYLITPETGDAAGLATAMQRVATMPEAELRRIGEAGRDFVLQHKNPRAQVGRILAGLFPQRSSVARERD